MKRHVTCFVEKAGFKPRTLGTKAERYDHCATRPVLVFLVNQKLILPCSGGESATRPLDFCPLLSSSSLLLFFVSVPPPSPPTAQPMHPDYAITIAGAAKLNMLVGSRTLAPQNAWCEFNPIESRPAQSVSQCPSQRRLSFGCCQPTAVQDLSNP